jgi:predicted nucleotidyltransferase component of viral defense system
MKQIKIVEYQQKVLKTLSHKIDGYYLAGGTALSLFYFQHRLSVDLDFFTPSFNVNDIKGVVAILKKELRVDVRLIAQLLEEKTAKIMQYNIEFVKDEVLRIDFVEDVHKLIKKAKNVDGIKVLSLEDIYMRKLYAIAGYVARKDNVGRRSLVGGRMEAKDFYDIYYLSHTFIPLSRFAKKYCDPVLIEGLIRWFHTYDRMNMMDGIFEIRTDKRIDYKKMEKYLSEEIDKIIEKEIGGI